MKAYTGTVTKTEFVKELERHQKADLFLKGTYSAGEKGCAVGCSLKSIAIIKGIKLDPSDHKEYETHLGIPEWLARVEDTIFEGLPLERSKSWPVEFATAIKEGSNLEKIKGPFLIMVLKSTLDTFDHEEHPDVKAAIDGSIELWQRDDIGSEEWHKAAAEAWAAADAAARAAAAAARAAAAAEAWADARYEFFADELLKLLRECE